MLSADFLKQSDSHHGKPVLLKMNGLQKQMGTKMKVVGLKPRSTLATDYLKHFVSQYIEAFWLGTK